MRPLLCALAFALVLGGCGARSGLITQTPNDLICPLFVYDTHVGDPVQLAVHAPAWAQGRLHWEIVTQPPSSAPQLVPDAGSGATFTSATEGVYRVRVTRPLSQDGGYPETGGADGGSDAGRDDGTTCVLTIAVHALGPHVQCPSDVNTAPLQEVSITATVAGDRPITSRRWTLTDAPAPSARPAPMPDDNATTRYRPDVAGDFHLHFVARDAAGDQGTCDVTVHAIPTEALRVEMYWNPPDRSCNDSRTGPPGCDGTDVDLHLLRASSGTWTSAASDCYYANCTRGSSPEWDAPGAADNPRLDIDDVNGFGPENINVDHAGSHSYRIGAHFYSGHNRTSADVFIRVYCGMSATPVRELGPVTLHAAMEDGTDPGNDFWNVADVVMSSGGCTVIPIERDGAPWVGRETDPGPPPPGP